MQWVLVLVFSYCVQTDPACADTLTYTEVARFATYEECKSKIRPEDQALHCLKG